LPLADFSFLPRWHSDFEEINRCLFKRAVNEEAQFNLPPNPPKRSPTPKLGEVVGE
jgi:hypothetical protein